MGGRMDDVDVELLAPERVAEVLSRIPGTSEDLVERVRASAHEDRRAALVATAGGLTRAVVHGTVTARGFRVLGWVGRPPFEAHVARRMFATALALFPGQYLDALLRDDETPEDLAAWLSSQGASAVERQMHYTRDITALADELAVLPPGISHRPYRAVGRARLAALLGRVFADSRAERTPDDPAAELDQMLHDAFSADDPNLPLWRVVLLDDEEIGVSLAHHQPFDAIGCLAYFGLVPALRGKRLAAPLHRETLIALAKAGARTYEDATSAGNVAMQRVFAVNGCTPTFRSTHWLLHVAREEGAIVSFESLASYLRSERYDVDVIEPGVWLSLVAHASRHHAKIEVGWLADARVVALQHVFCTLTHGARADGLVRLANRLNAELTFPGFIFDEGTGEVSFRIALHMNRAGAVDVDALRRGLGTVVQTSASHGADIRTSAGSDQPLYGDPLFAPPREPHPP
ncbi:MAG: hypothetical protein U0414_16980 [Polyangiaceae bacterium]